MKDRVSEVLKFLSENNIEIVSYGLAPNPDGFCYESAGLVEAAELNDLLGELTTKEVQRLRAAIFGEQRGGTP